jgi:hypothetical protein
MDILSWNIPIEFNTNFDIEASVEFEFDQGLFTMSLSEIEKDEEGQVHAV